MNTFWKSFQNQLMFRKKIDHRGLEQQLRAPIASYHWDTLAGPEYEAGARVALLEMLKIAKKQLPRTQIVFIGRDDVPLHDANPNYLELLLRIRKFMATGQWVKTCEDMVDVLHFFHIEDRRILGNIILTLEEFLHDTEGDVFRIKASD